MAIATIADMVIQPHKFAEYTIKRTTEKSMLVRSGVASSDERISQLINGTPKGGHLIQLPFFKPLDGEDEVFGEYTMEPEGIETGSEYATILVRQKSWGDTDLSQVYGGADPMAAIGNLASDWWVIREQAVMQSVLKGVFGDALSAHILDVSKDAADNYIDVDTTLDAKNLMGDAYDKLGLVFMHSATYTQLQKQQQITTEYDSDLKVEISYYLGYMVVVDDGMPVLGGVYDTFFLGKGCIARNDGMLQGLVGYEVDRNKLGAENYLINRRCLIMHPRGISFNPAASFGTQKNGKPRKYARNADLANPENWSLAEDLKNIPMVCLRHKLHSSKTTSVAEYLKALTVASAAGTASGTTAVTVTEGKLDGANTYVYKVGKRLSTPLINEICNDDAGYAAWDGEADIEAPSGTKILVVEVDASGKAKAAGVAAVTVKG